MIKGIFAVENRMGRGEKKRRFEETSFSKKKKLSIPLSQNKNKNEKTLIIEIGKVLLYIK